MKFRDFFKGFTRIQIKKLALKFKSLLKFSHFCHWAEKHVLLCKR